MYLLFGLILLERKLPPLFIAAPVYKQQASPAKQLNVMAHRRNAVFEERLLTQNSTKKMYLLFGLILLERTLPPLFIAAPVYKHQGSPAEQLNCPQ
jgi:hypothetical protein